MVNETRTGSESPRIDIYRTAGEIVISQHRPSVLAHLTGMGVAQALALVPTVLPICGAAQSVAALRAVEAAREEEAAGWETQRNQQLWREQALSAAWRLAVDWPDLLSVPRDLAWLKALRAGADEQAVELLDKALAGLCAVTTVEDLASWAREGDSTAAALAQRAFACATEAGSAPLQVQALQAEALSVRARALLASADYDPAAAMAETVEVGPLAMRRDALIGAIVDQYGHGTCSRLLALLVDMRHIIAGLAGGVAPDEEVPTAWPEGDRVGTGCACTARGPVFHRVELDDRDRVRHWRAVAPTDWHFAPGGPVAAALADCDDESHGRLRVASFDPCAPWSLQLAGGN